MVHMIEIVRQGKVDFPQVIMNRAIQVKPADSENRGEVVSIAMKSMFLVSPSQELIVVPQQQQVQLQQQQQQQQSVCSTSAAC